MPAAKKSKSGKVKAERKAPIRTEPKSKKAKAPAPEKKAAVKGKAKSKKPTRRGK